MQVTDASVGGFAGTCYDGECEGLHEDPDVRIQQRTWQKPEKGKLIIAAGTALMQTTCSRSLLFSMENNCERWSADSWEPNAQASPFGQVLSDLGAHGCSTQSDYFTRMLRNHWTPSGSPQSLPKP